MPLLLGVGGEVVLKARSQGEQEAVAARGTGSLEPRQVRLGQEDQELDGLKDKEGK
jgi:hypothetical protein